MTYELAKKLKDAGFYQFHSGDSHWLAQGIDRDFYYGVDDKGNIKGINNPEINPMREIAFRPSLIQLIEACGEDFYNLEHVFDGGLDGNEELWWASGKNNSAGGENPEIAVSYLWLLLQKK